MIRYPIAMGELVPANRELEPGLHRLFAATQLADGTTVKRRDDESLAPIAYVPFWLGQAAEEQAPELMREASRKWSCSVREGPSIARRLPTTCSSTSTC